MTASVGFVYQITNKKSMFAAEYLEGEKEWLFNGRPTGYSGISSVFAEVSDKTPYITSQGHLVYRASPSGPISRTDGPAIVLNSGTRVFALKGKTISVEFCDGEVWTPER